VQAEFDFGCSGVAVVDCFGILELAPEEHLIVSVQILGYSLEVGFLGFLDSGFFAELVFLVQSFPVFVEALVVLALDLFVAENCFVGVVVGFEGDLVVDDFVGVFEVSVACQTTTV
jgi:hypothetical protein